MKMDKEKCLPVSPNGPFQSFSGSMWSAIEFGGNDRSGDEIPILVSAKPDPALIMFGMDDLKASRNPILKSALNRVKSWHYQDEVFVRVDGPLPVLSVDKVDAVMDDEV